MKLETELFIRVTGDRERLHVSYYQFGVTTLLLEIYSLLQIILVTSSGI